MLASSQQIAITCKNEGFSPVAYKDGFVNGVQRYSIGYGHQIQDNETALLTATINQSQALALMQGNITSVENAIDNYSDGNLNQAQYDAVFDFGYNAGIGALQKVLSTWNDGNDPIAVCTEMAMYDKYHNSAGILVVNQDLQSRRKQETDEFMSTNFPVTDGSVTDSTLASSLIPSWPIIAGVAALAIGAFFYFS